MANYRVGYTADFFQGETARFEDYGEDRLRALRSLEIHRLQEVRAEIGADQIAGLQSLVVLAGQVTEDTLADAADFLSINRFGVGYDNVDVAACTRANVLVTITRGAVDRPVAEAIVGWLIALSHHFRAKDRIVREGCWDERTRWMGTELRDRTLGVIGFGGIGRALVGLLSGFGMQTPLVFDPYLDEASSTRDGVRPVSLLELLEQSDFVSINCPLTDDTRDLIGDNELAAMKSSAFLVNTARGGIVNENALYAALEAGKIAGAAIDCFDGEPLTAPHRFGTLDNVLLAPHCIAWTYELFRDIGRTASQAIIDLAEGRQPGGVINSELFERPEFMEKWSRLAISSPN